MSKWRKHILAIALLGISCSVQAQTSMVMTLTDDTSSEYPLDNVNKIEFYGQGLTIRMKDGKGANAMYGEIRKITFKDNATGINAQVVATNGMQLYKEGMTIGARNLDQGTAYRAMVVDLSGRTLMNLHNWDGQPISIASLNKGVYVFIVNNNAIKFTK